ncbi:MAG TPA: energy transducer TonB [Cytophagaceae bacterium]|jgi:hypothetical protein
MKPSILLAFTFILTSVFNSYAQDSVKRDSVIRKTVEVLPEYPGGHRAFLQYISKTVKYPELAGITGLNGRVVMQFVVEKDGTIADIKPLTCIGAGCESEAARVISQSKIWKPGRQDGRPVRVQYSMPISFNAYKEKVTLNDFEKSDYGFVFKIHDKEFQLNEAREQLGNRFPSKWIVSTLPYPEQINKLPGKKETYLVTINKDK